GGTSCSTPVWSALIAIADQGRATLSQGPLDGPSQTLPMLYGLSSSDFHDITTQNNGTQSLPVGYDLVTGRGTPIANKLVPNLAGFTTTGATGSISGTIFNDANGNGKQDSGETGISGWIVYNDANNNGKLDIGELSTTTDTSGAYTFPGLAAGKYKIR